MIIKNPQIWKWFTLIEVLVSVTIISIIMLSVLFIYSNIIEINQKLQFQRIMQENTKNIVESLASEVRNNWINYTYFSPSSIDYVNWDKILPILNSWEYCMMTNKTFCDSNCLTNPKWCFLWKLNTDISLNTDFVEISNLKFYISWKNANNITSADKQWKVTVVFDIKIAEQKWIPLTLIDATKMHIQTTISEMYYKK